MLPACDKGSNFYRLMNPYPIHSDNLYFMALGNPKSTFFKKAIDLQPDTL